MRYIPNSQADRQQMLAEIGVDSTAQIVVSGDLLDSASSAAAQRPLTVRVNGETPLVERKSFVLPGLLLVPGENRVEVTAEDAAGNVGRPGPSVASALRDIGSGWDPQWHQPSDVFSTYSDKDFRLGLNAAQTTLAAVAQLTGMEVANASLYDGSTGLAEAILMAQRVTRKNKFLVARSVHPEYRAVVDTYAKNLGIQIELIGYAPDGRMNLEQLASKLDSNTAAVVMQSPNFFGTIERTHDVAEMAHRHDALSITNVCEAISLGILKPAGEDQSEKRRADIVVGEAQSFGIPPSFGGPHVGFPDAAALC